MTRSMLFGQRTSFETAIARLNNLRLRLRCRSSLLGSKSILSFQDTQRCRTRGKQREEDTDARSRQRHEGDPFPLVPVLLSLASSSHNAHSPLLDIRQDRLKLEKKHESEDLERPSWKWEVDICKEACKRRLASF